MEYTNKRKPGEEPWGCPTENVRRGEKAAGGEIKEENNQAGRRESQERRVKRWTRSEASHVAQKVWTEKAQRRGNVEVTADLGQSGLPAEAGKKLKSQCIPINTNDFNPIANNLGLYFLSNIRGKKEERKR